MGEHTSGMWRARKTAINRWVIGAHQGEDYVPIGVASLTLLEVGRGSEEEHEANARLIAAAPDLLAAGAAGLQVLEHAYALVPEYYKAAITIATLELRGAINKAKEEPCQHSPE